MELNQIQQSLSSTGRLHAPIKRRLPSLGTPPNASLQGTAQGVSGFLKRPKRGRLNNSSTSSFNNFFGQKNNSNLTFSGRFGFKIEEFKDSLRNEYVTTKEMKGKYKFIDNLMKTSEKQLPRLDRSNDISYNTDRGKYDKDKLLITKAAYEVNKEFVLHQKIDKFVELDLAEALEYVKKKGIPHAQHSGFEGFENMIRNNDLKKRINRDSCLKLKESTQGIPDQAKISYWVKNSRVSNTRAQFVKFKEWFWQKHEAVSSSFEEADKFSLLFKELSCLYAFCFDFVINDYEIFCKERGDFLRSLYNKLIELYNHSSSYFLRFFENTQLIFEEKANLLENELRAEVEVSRLRVAKLEQDLAESRDLYSREKFKVNKFGYKLSNLKLAMRYQKEDSQSLIHLNSILERENEQITEVVKETIDGLELIDGSLSDKVCFMREKLSEIHSFKTSYKEIKASFNQTSISNRIKIDNNADNENINEAEEYELPGLANKCTTTENEEYSFAPQFFEKDVEETSVQVAVNEMVEIEIQVDENELQKNILDEGATKIEMNIPERILLTLPFPIEDYQENNIEIARSSPNFKQDTDTHTSENSNKGPKFSSKIVFMLKKLAKKYRKRSKSLSHKTRLDNPNSPRSGRHRNSLRKSIFVRQTNLTRGNSLYIEDAEIDKHKDKVNQQFDKITNLTTKYQDMMHQNVALQSKVKTLEKLLDVMKRQATIRDTTPVSSNRRSATPKISRHSKSRGNNKKLKFAQIENEEASRVLHKFDEVRNKKRLVAPPKLVILQYISSIYWGVILKIERGAIDFNNFVPMFTLKFFREKYSTKHLSEKKMIEFIEGVQQQTVSPRIRLFLRFLGMKDSLQDYFHIFIRILMELKKTYRVMIYKETRDNPKLFGSSFIDASDTIFTASFDQRTAEYLKSETRRAIGKPNCDLDLLFETLFTSLKRKGSLFALADIVEVLQLSDNMLEKRDSNFVIWICNLYRSLASDDAIITQNVPHSEISIEEMNKHVDLDFEAVKLLFEVDSKITEKYYQNISKLETKVLLMYLLHNIRKDELDEYDRLRMERFKIFLTNRDTLYLQKIVIGMYMDFICQCLEKALLLFNSELIPSELTHILNLN